LTDEKIPTTYKRGNFQYGEMGGFYMKTMAAKAAQSIGGWEYSNRNAKHVVRFVNMWPLLVYPMLTVLCAFVALIL